MFDPFLSLFIMINKSWRSAVCRVFPKCLRCDFNISILSPAMNGHRSSSRLLSLGLDRANSRPRTGTCVFTKCCQQGNPDKY